MHEKSKSRAGNGFTASMATVDPKELRSLSRAQAERFWRMQAHLLENFETMSRAWLERRRAATEAALRTATKICDCNDPAEAASACNEFLAGSMERLAEDGRAMGELSMKLFQDMAGAMEAAAPTTATGAAPRAPAEKAPRPERPDVSHEKVVRRAAS